MDKSFKLADWLVQPELGIISNSQESINLEPKAMALLVVLAKANGELVSRERLFSSVWPNQFVTDHTLNTLISNLRKSLKRLNPNKNLIETRAKLGYRLSQQVTWLQPTTKDELENQHDLSRSTKRIGITIVLIALIALGLFFFTNKSSDVENHTGPSIANISSTTNSSEKKTTISDYQVIRYLVKITLSYSKTELDSTGKALCENYSYENLSKAIYKNHKWVIGNENLSFELKHKSRSLSNFKENYQVEFPHVLGKEQDTMSITFDGKGNFSGSGIMKVFNNQNKLICTGRALYIGTKIKA